MEKNGLYGFRKQIEGRVFFFCLRHPPPGPGVDEAFVDDGTHTCCDCGRYLFDVMIEEEK